MLDKKYRPQTWDEVVGNESTVKSLQSLLVSDTRPHFFLFIGDRGTGKTTCARLIASTLGITQTEEINAADNNGVDFARDLEKRIQYKTFGTDKMYIIDECQRLTAEAQDILLKNVLEETPEHAYVVFCTTDPQRIKITVKSRASTFYMERPTKKQVVDHLSYVADKEGVDVPRSFLAKIAVSNDRILRECLITLNKIKAKGLTEEEIESIIYTVTGESSQAIELARALLRSSTWKSISEIMSGLDDNPENVVFMIRNYMGKVLLKEENNVAYNVLMSFGHFAYGSGMTGLIQVCYEAMLRNRQK